MKFKFIKISVVIIVFSIFLIGGWIQVPCKIDCSNLKDEIPKNSFGAVSGKKLIESRQSCTINGINPIASRFGCNVKPFFLRNNVLYWIVYFLIIPSTLSLFFIKLINKRLIKY
jgi:hypothetical protein